jgi:hypothetical protein
MGCEVLDILGSEILVESEPVFVLCGNLNLDSRSTCSLELNGEEFSAGDGF